MKKCIFSINQTSLSTTYLIYTVPDNFNSFYDKNECVSYIKTKLHDKYGYNIKLMKNIIRTNPPDRMFISWSETMSTSTTSSLSSDDDEHVIEFIPGSKSSRTHVIASLLQKRSM